MAISYTDNFSFPLLDDGCENWMAVINGVLEDLDLYLAEARNPLTWDDSEVLVYDGDVLLYA